MAAVRTGIGVALLVRPELLARSLGVDSLTASRVGWVSRMVGVREVVLGLGGLRAVLRGRDVRDWVHAQATCDAVDAAAVALAVARGQVAAVSGTAWAALAAGSTAAHLRALPRP
jgi:hypothetical protein